MRIGRVQPKSHNVFEINVNMKRFWAVAAFLSIVLSFTVSAAIVKGSLVSGTDGSPLSGASVRLMRNNATSMLMGSLPKSTWGACR